MEIPGTSFLVNMVKQKQHFIPRAIKEIDVDIKDL